MGLQCSSSDRVDGYRQRSYVGTYLEEVLNILGVPSLTKQIVTKASFEQLLLESMVKTGSEEKHTAK